MTLKNTDEETPNWNPYQTVAIRKSREGQFREAPPKVSTNQKTD